MLSHRPIFDVSEVEKVYSEKDGVPVRYLCTSAVDFSNKPRDVFFRNTPHPKFGNRYFGLLKHNGKVYISNADKIEDLEFDTIKYNGLYHYSSHRHDFLTVGDVSIDGGRAYTRLVGNINVPVTTFVVRDGDFKIKGEDVKCLKLS